MAEVVPNNGRWSGLSLGAVRSAPFIRLNLAGQPPPTESRTIALFAGSLAMHAIVVALALFLRSQLGPRFMEPECIEVQHVILAKKLYYGPARDQLSGGGGGGIRETTPEQRNPLPKPTLRPFVPPRQDPVPTAKLRLVEGVEIDFDPADAAAHGNPLAPRDGRSNGQGSGGSMGAGTGVGIGSGEERGFGGGKFQLGGGLRPLIPGNPLPAKDGISQKLHGVMLLRFTVDEHGFPQNIEIGGSHGKDLDEQALAWLRKERFAPALTEEARKKRMERAYHFWVD